MTVIFMMMILNFMVNMLSNFLHIHLPFNPTFVVVVVLATSAFSMTKS